MSSDIAIKVENLSKCFQVYEQPLDRLKQFVLPQLQRTMGQQTKQYFKEFWALKDISLEIKKGETIGIVGRNGSGKSTLLQIICGTLSPTSGTVDIQGRVAALLELGAGFNTEFTGRENVILNAEILGFPRNEMLARMEEVLDFSELGEYIDQPVKTYSSGMYARLAFSIAIHVDPDILIVDEALAVGDSRFVSKCMRRIKDIQKKGATILFVSHDAGTIRTLCEQVLWLDKGHSVEMGDVFPVTGRFMEFMFKGEKNEHESLHDKIVSQVQDAPSTNSAVSSNKSVAEASDESLQVTDARPVTHWGSHKGVVISAGICDEQGVQRDVFDWGKVISVVIEVRIPSEISREYLSIAFSIKDLKGTDLIVSTTNDFELTSLPDKEHFSVSFRLTNPLVTGKYLLVVAVENRQNHDVHYYEYMEGIHYFASLADKRFFGIFQPAIEQQILIK